MVGFFHALSYEPMSIPSQRKQMAPDRCEPVKHGQCSNLMDLNKSRIILILYYRLKIKVLYLYYNFKT
jgi:hypothetical protein